MRATRLTDVGILSGFCRMYTDIILTVWKLNYTRSMVEAPHLAHMRVRQNLQHVLGTEQVVLVRLD